VLFEVRINGLGMPQLIPLLLQVEYFTQLSTIDPNFQDIPVDWTEHFSISSGKKLSFAEMSSQRKENCH